MIMIGSTIRFQTDIRIKKNNTSLFIAIFTNNFFNGFQIINPLIKFIIKNDNFWIGCQFCNFMNVSKLRKDFRWNFVFFSVYFQFAIMAFS